MQEMSPHFIIPVGNRRPRGVEPLRKFRSGPFRVMLMLTFLPYKGYNNSNSKWQGGFNG